MALEPDGFFLSNGPGDPAATADYAVPVIRRLLETGKPLFGICLGHQLLGRAGGARTTKMFQGQSGANHPGKRAEEEKAERKARRRKTKGGYWVKKKKEVRENYKEDKKDKTEGKKKQRMDKKRT